jgi:hypothetical protein
MRRRNLLGILMLAAILVTPAGAPAHHGWSNFDQSVTLTLNGKIVEVIYQNPHVTVRMESDGTVWLAILGPPVRMRNRGLPAAKLAPGTMATIVGYPHRDTPHEMRAERITIDGKTVELR